MDPQIDELLLESSLTLSVAESCTGGSLSARLTSVPGSSKYFKGGVISYSVDSKIRDLAVKKEDIEKFSDVSKKVAEQMSIGVRARFKTDLSIGITGYAGPDGIDVGKVFISFSSRKGTVVNQFKFLGNREDIISQIIEACLSTLSSEIKLLICNGK